MPTRHEAAKYERERMMKTRNGNENFFQAGVTGGAMAGTTLADGGHRWKGKEKKREKEHFQKNIFCLLFYIIHFIPLFTSPKIKKRILLENLSRQTAFNLKRRREGFCL